MRLTDATFTTTGPETEMHILDGLAAILDEIVGWDRNQFEEGETILVDSAAHHLSFALDHLRILGDM